MCIALAPLLKGAVTAAGGDWGILILRQILDFAVQHIADLGDKIQVNSFNVALIISVNHFVLDPSEGFQAISGNAAAVQYFRQLDLDTSVFIHAVADDTSDVPSPHPLFNCILPPDSPVDIYHIKGYPYIGEIKRLKEWDFVKEKRSCLRWCG